MASDKSNTVNQNQVKKDWAARRFSFGTWTDPPGQVWENFVHDTDELFILVEGRIEVEMQGKTFCPEKGLEILIPANTLHTVRNVGGTTARWLYGYKK